MTKILIQSTSIKRLRSTNTFTEIIIKNY